MPAHCKPFHVCRSCHETLPRDAFDIVFRVDKHTGKTRNTGADTHCRVCRAATIERLTRPEYFIDEETGCWNWNRSKGSNGYGIIVTSKGSRNLIAHRHVYERHKGPIPEGLTLDHLCRNRGCVNPDHLEPVTYAENNRRSPTTKINVEIAAQIKRAVMTDRSNKNIADRFSVSHHIVDTIRHNRTWKDVQAADT